MGLKVKVKVSEVNNLSDARYCAGMGVDMIGFHLDTNHPRFIELSSVREIVNWVHGIKVVGEFSVINIENINYLAEELNLDYVQLPATVSAEKLNSLNRPVIVRIDLRNGEEETVDQLMETLGAFVTFFLLESDEVDSIEAVEVNLKRWASQYPVILGIGIEKEKLSFIEDYINPAAIALKGGDEIRPGLKNFDELAEILEELESE